MFNKKLRKRIASLEDYLWVVLTVSDGYPEHVARDWWFIPRVNKFLEDNKKK